MTKRFLLVLAGMLFIISVEGQSKIGALTIPDSIFREYLLDCYNRPDTLRGKNLFDNIHDGQTFMADEYDRMRKDVEDYNKWLQSVTIGEVVKTVHYKARIDTIYTDGSSSEYEFIIADKPIKNKPKKIASIQNVPAGSYVDHKGLWLVPRKPTEYDYIKWVKKHSK